MTTPEQKRTLRLALADPGVFTERRRNLGPENDEDEPLYEWQARAIAIYLREQGQSLEDASDALFSRAAEAMRTLANLIDERKA